MSIKFNSASLLKPKRLMPNLSQEVVACLRNKGAIRLALGQEECAVAAQANSPGQQFITLTGHWRSSWLENQYNHVGALLLIPFVFRVYEILIPYNCLYTTGRDDRSIADFFMRNFFYAACRGETIVKNPITHQLGGAILKSSHDLTRTYTWILNANLKEPVFSNANVNELILACAHMSLSIFGCELLEKGAVELRQTAISANKYPQQFMRNQTLIEARRRMMDTYNK